MPQTKLTPPARRKTTDWNKKNGADSARISKRLEHRSELKDSATTTNDTGAPKTYPPRAVGAPLLRLRQKIKEIYDEDDEENDNNAPLLHFNISLINDKPNQLEDETQKKAELASETIRIAKEQQTAGKLNLIMDTAMTVQKAGLKAKITKKDLNLANSPELDLKKIKKKTLKDKVETPLKLQGELPETELEEALLGIKKAIQKLPPDSLDDFPAADLSELEKQPTDAEMADLILKKSGRKKQKKNLVEIAKGLNKFKNFEPENQNDKEKD